MAWFSEHDLTEEQTLAHKIATIEIPNYLTTGRAKYDLRKKELVAKFNAFELRKIRFNQVIK